MINGLPTRISELRRARGYSQQQIAKKLQVSPSIISGYETGERTPSTENLLALSNLFDCSTDYLLGKTNNSPQSTVNIEGLTQEQQIAIINLIETMRDTSR